MPACPLFRSCKLLKALLMGSSLLKQGRNKLELLKSCEQFHAMRFIKYLQHFNTKDKNVKHLLDVVFEYKFMFPFFFFF